MDIFNPTPKESAKSAAIKRELARRANDRIKVHNPLSQPFEEMWDRWKFRVPAVTEDIGHGLGNQIFPRYLALNYVTHMSDKLLIDEADRAVAEANELRKKRGQEPLNKWEDEDKIQTPILKNEKKRADYIRQLWLGIVSEYGIDNLPESTETKPQDRRPFTEKIIEELEFTSGVETEKELIQKVDKSVIDAQLDEVAENNV